MSHRVTFIDTSVLVNIVPVPGRDQARDHVLSEFRQRIRSGEQFILPITTVIETGNHIAQLSDGHGRRSTATTFTQILEQIVEGEAPFILHDVAWNQVFLQRLLDGSTSGVPYVEHASHKVGAGDLCILTERESYQQRVGQRVEVSIWTLDAGLRAHS